MLRQKAETAVLARVVYLTARLATAESRDWPRNAPVRPIPEKPLGQRQAEGASGEVLMLKFVSFGLVLLMSVPALADKPAAPVTVEGSVAVDGSGVTGEQNVPEVMFGGKAPPHGFQICRFVVPGPCCSVAFSDIPNSPSVSYYQLTAQPVQNMPNHGQCYTTPLGYKPAGPVYILSPDNTGVPFFARMW
jgi:hypothetical protein